MAIRPHKTCLMVLIAAYLWAACSGDDDFDQTSIISAGSPDSGASDPQADGFDAGADAGRIDLRCDGLQSGARCALANASGVCIDGRCQFLSCESGFRDCDANRHNGCETDITTAQECGACGVSCDAPSSCQLSGAGWVCSVSPVCPDEHFDLDGDRENGCEWRAEWGEDSTFDLVSMTLDVATELSTGAFAVAGRTLDVRLVTSTEATDSDAAGASEPIATDFDETIAAHAITELRAPNHSEQGDHALVAVAWTDALTLSSATGSKGDDGVFRFACEQIPAQFNAVAGSADSPVFATTSREVLQVDRGASCALNATAASADRQLCETPSAIFGLSDYIEAYATGVDPSNCEDCLPDTTICPEFRPIGLDYLEQSARVVVFTTRGFFILDTSDAGFVAGPRLEFDALEETSETEQGATRYAAGAAVEDEGITRVYLLTTDGILRRFVVDASVRPAGPDVRLLIGASDPARLVPGADGTLLIYDARHAWLLQLLDLSARIEQLPEPDIFLGNQRIVYGAGYTTVPADEFSMLYFGVGRYYLRHVRR